jgi:predicted flap endonuclease-1-like 5' DNA nuclease
MLNITNAFSFVFAFLAEDDNGGLPWWAWLLIIIVVILLLWFLWRWFTRPKSSAPFTTQPAAAPAQRAAAPVIPVPATPVKPDDLTIIEGIGPKIASLLQTAGIATFSQLAGADLSKLVKILEDAGLKHLADPATWAEQAKLAAEGKWEELKVLTDSLKGGRRA